jgi:hypothetical protein
MKVTFELDTNDENFDQFELNRLNHATDMALCLYKITNKLRDWHKYDARDLIPTEEIYEVLWNIINEHINLEKIIH